jgi:hypothetical protein
MEDFPAEVKEITVGLCLAEKICLKRFLCVCISSLKTIYFFSTLKFSLIYVINVCMVFYVHVDRKTTPLAYA